MADKEEKLLDKKISRRQLLKYTGVGAIGVALGASGLGGIVNTFGMMSPEDDTKVANKVLFYGQHQSGIATEAQSHGYFAAVNVLVSSKSELQDLFKMWTPLAVRLMNGDPSVAATANGFVPPKDTGEATGLNASNLTLTFGVGPSLFDKMSFGLQVNKPKELKDLPHFPKDQLDPAYSGGDICIQACADDPQVAFHAVRNLIRAASGKVTLAWSQAGFNSFPMEKNQKQTPRNLFAFKDGTVNPNPKNKQDMDEVVWIQPGDSKEWMTDGTYLIVRRIQMHLETWDRTALQEQEVTFGRHRDSGAPLGKVNEFDDLELDRKDVNGKFIIPENSHSRLGREAGARILRRPFSYSSGVIDETGAYDAGLLFISFQKDPKQFITIQNSFGRVDKLNEYITHRGSAMFACFPGIQKGSYIGEALFSIL